MAYFFRYFIISVIIFFSMEVKFSLMVLFLLLFSRWKKAAFVLIISWCYVFCFVYFYWPEPLPSHFNNKKIEVHGIVITKPIINKTVTQFMLLVNSVNAKKNKKKLQLKMTDYKSTYIYQEGDVLTAIVKVKQFHDYLNIGSAPYKKMQYARGRSGTGYIIKLLSHQHTPKGLLSKIKFSLAQMIKNLYHEPFAFALMNSLLIGDRTHLSREDWLRFQLTGTSHLIAISGLHVGLIAFSVYWFISLIWRCSSSLCRLIAAHQIAALFALVAAFSYSLLSGFSIPTQRAFLMSFVFLSAKVCNKKTHVWHSYFLSMFLVLLFNPFSIFLAGFYLSFFVVFILIWFSTISKWSVLNVQLKIWLLLMPISLYIFHYYSLASIPANLIAIPLVSFIILPLGFLSLFAFYLHTPVATLLANSISLVIDFFNKYLSVLANQQELSIHFYPPNIGVILIITFLLFYALNLKQWNFWSIVLIVSGVLIYPYKQNIAHNNAMISMLDVGQGLSVFVQTKNHALLYDTGGRFNSGFNLGEAVIIPYLIIQGIYYLDALVISHEDLDHRGGFESIRKVIKINKIYRNGKVGFQNCHQSKGWQWDGLNFYFLSADNLLGQSQNNQSCVLIIENKYQRIIFPGDIEQRVEQELVEKYKNTLKSTVLIAPHHGSKTSSSVKFLKEINPHYVFISAGRDNRYRQPHQSVLKRYASLAISAFNTAKMGMIQWQLSDQNTIKRPYFPFQE